VFLQRNAIKFGKESNKSELHSLRNYGQINSRILDTIYFLVSFISFCIHLYEVYVTTIFQ
jgi:hypothetical protein